jgi:hypothetical protein
MPPNVTVRNVPAISTNQKKNKRKAPTSEGIKYIPALATKK